MNYQSLVYIHDNFVLSFQQITHIDSSTLNVSLGEVLCMSIPNVYLAPSQLPMAGFLRIVTFFKTNNKDAALRRV